MEKNESHKMNMNNFQEQITSKLPFVKTPLFYSLNTIKASTKIKNSSNNECQSNLPEPIANADKSK